MFFSQVWKSNPEIERESGWLPLPVLLEMTTEGVLIFELVQNDEMEGREGDLKKKFQKGGTRWVMSSEACAMFTQW